MRTSRGPQNRHNSHEYSFVKLYNRANDSPTGSVRPKMPPALQPTLPFPSGELISRTHSILNSQLSNNRASETQIDPMVKTLDLELRVTFST